MLFLALIDSYVAKILKTSFSQSLLATALVHQTYGNASSGVQDILHGQPINLCSSIVIFSDQVMCMFV